MRTIVTLLLAFGSLALGQGVLDKLKQKVDQLNRVGQPQQQKQGQPPAQPAPQPNSSRRPGNSPSSVAAPVGDVATLAAGAGFVDIAGMKPGMSVKETMLALRAVNPNLTLNPNTFRLEGFGSQDLLDTVNAYTTNGQEQITLAFTVPPGPEVLWGLTRQLKSRCRRVEKSSRNCKRSTGRKAPFKDPAAMSGFSMPEAPVRVSMPLTLAATPWSPESRQTSRTGTTSALTDRPRRKTIATE